MPTLELLMNIDDCKQIPERITLKEQRCIWLTMLRFLSTILEPIVPQHRARKNPSQGTSCEASILRQQAQKVSKSKGWEEEPTARNNQKDTLRDLYPIDKLSQNPQYLPKQCHQLRTWA